MKGSDRTVETSRGAPENRAGFLHAFLDAAAATWPEVTAVVCGAEATTFVELASRVTRLASALPTLADSGERVAILAENSIGYVECLYGIPRAAMVAVPLNYRLHPSEWIEQLRRAEVAVVIGERMLLDRLRDALCAQDQSIPSMKSVVAFDDAGPSDLDYEELLGADAKPPSASALTQSQSVDDVAWMLFTSGTTGVPKAAMLTHASLGAAIDVNLAVRDIRNGDVYCFPFPLCHVAAYNVFVMHRRACPVVLLRRFEPLLVFAQVDRYKVSIVSLAPTMLEMMLASPELSGFDGSSLRVIQYGASAISAPLLRRVMAAFSCDLSQGYGMTEMSGNMTFLSEEDHQRALAGDGRLLGSAGRVGPGVELRIVDELLVERPVGAVGEIMLRAPQMMAGYWRDPDATNAAIVDGWLRTGDLGSLDGDGYLFVLDRMKDVIVSGGENVASREVEDVLRRWPGVRDVAVIGVPDERWGERVCAVVVPVDPLFPPDSEELIAFAAQHLAGFKKPRAVVFVDSLPVNHAGKVAKKTLRERWATFAPAALDGA